MLRRICAKICVFKMAQIGWLSDVLVFRWIDDIKVQFV